MDATLTHWINASAGLHPVLDKAMIGASQIGVPIMVLAVVLQWWVKVDRYYVRHAALSAGLAFLVGLAINQFILLFVHRGAPYDAGVPHLWIAPSADWSFPSVTRQQPLRLLRPLRCKLNKERFVMKKAAPLNSVACVAKTVAVCSSPVPPVAVDRGELSNVRFHDGNATLRCPL